MNSATRMHVTEYIRLEPGDVLLAPQPWLQELRLHAADNLARLPEPLQRLQASNYRVEIAPALYELAARIDHESISAQANTTT